MSDVTADVATPDVGVAEAKVNESVPAKEVMPKTKMKINGSEREYSFEELKLLASKAAGSDAKVEEAAKMRKDVEDNILSPLKQKQLVKALEAQGFTRKEAMEVLEEQLAAMYDEEAMDPKDKLIKELQEKEDKRKQEEETVKERQAREKEEAEIRKEIEDFENEMFEAISKSTDLPKNPVFARQAAVKIKSAERKGIDLSAQDAVKMVEQDFLHDLQAILPKLGVKQLKKYLGEQAIKDILNDSTSALKEAQSPFGKPSKAPRQEYRSKKEEGPKESMRDYFIKLKSGK